MNPLFLLAPRPYDTEQFGLLSIQPGGKTAISRRFSPKPMVFRASEGIQYEKSEPLIEFARGMEPLPLPDGTCEFVVGD